MNIVKIVYVFMALTLFACKPKNNTTLPVRKNLTQAVYASGKIYPVNDYKVFTKFPGYVQKIHVKVGDQVKAGDPLITIKSEVNELATEAARNAADLALRNASPNSAYMNALKSDVAVARTKYELDSMNFVRYNNLNKENAISKVQFDQAKVQYEVSRQNYQKALNAYLNLKDKANTEAQNATLQYEAQNANKNEFVIVAEQSGRVYDIDTKVGELVNIQKPVMEIGDARLYQVELSIDETDISLIKAGQEVVYSVDAFKDKNFKGKIIEAYPRISASNKTSKVIANIEGLTENEIYSGMSAEANIIIAKKTNVLVIPREYLVDGNKVKLKEKGDTIKIKIGAEDLENVEVTDGLTETQEIIKP